MDWREVVRGVAPGLAALAGGPLAGSVVKVLAENILGRPDATEADLQEALAGGATPEVRKAIIDSQAQIKLALIQAGVDQRKLDAEIERAYLSDVDSARRAHGTNKDVVHMAYAILAVWALLTGGTLWGLYQMATGGIQLSDAGLAATVFTLLGSLTGYVSNAAQQILGYFFGSSRGSAEKTTALTEAVTGRR